MRERDHVPAKLLTEKQIYQNQIDRTLRPYKNGATKFVKGLVKVGRGAGKGIVDGLNYLGREGQKPHRPHKEAPIDLGFGGNIKPAEYRRRLAKKLKSSRGKARIRRAKINLAKKRVQQNRFAKFLL